MSVFTLRDMAFLVGSQGTELVSYPRTTEAGNQRTTEASNIRTTEGSNAGVVDEDADAVAYLNAVEVADGEALETTVRAAINDFVVGCKTDGIWDAIKASCILAGARTLSGALVPLVGNAPTNFNFVNGDYSRKTGLIGNGASKYLDSNRADNEDPQNSHHLSVWVEAVGDGMYIGVVGAGANVSSQISKSAAVVRVAERVGLGGISTTGASSLSNGFYGTSRFNSNNYNWVVGESNDSISTTSVLPTTGNTFVFARSITGTGPSTYSSARIAFYSIGESINLSLLKARVSALMAALNSAIS